MILPAQVNFTLAIKITYPRGIREAGAEDTFGNAVAKGSDKMSAYQEIMAKETLQDLKDFCSNCHLCLLGENRKHVVFGEGNPVAQVMLVGEAPGANENETGRPFVGQAGKVLTELLAEVGIKRDEVYITSINKCRPPQNRKPKKAEARACIPYLKRQIQLVQPRIICCLGSLALENLVDPKAKITQMRGKWVVKAGMEIMPTFHPAALFRDRKKREPLRQDLLAVKRRLDAIGLSKDGAICHAYTQLLV